MKDSQKKKLLAVTGQAEIGFIASGIESSETGHIISEDGLTRIAEALEGADVTAAALTQTESNLEAANTARTAAEAELETRTQELATANTRIQELEARVTELENESGIENTTKQEDKIKAGKKPYHASDENPMNKIADGLLGKPRQAEEA